MHYELTVSEEHVNRHETLHGGCIATLVDVVGSVAIATLGSFNHVSIDINGTNTRSREAAPNLPALPPPPSPSARSAPPSSSALRPTHAVTYLAAAPLGSTVRITGRCPRLGGRIGFSEVELRDAESDELLAQGRHTKAILNGGLPKSKL